MSPQGRLGSGFLIIGYPSSSLMFFIHKTSLEINPIPNLEFPSLDGFLEADRQNKAPIFWMTL
jgi:hypothetical protein